MPITRTVDILSMDKRVIDCQQTYPEWFTSLEVQSSHYPKQLYICKHSNG